MQNNVWFWIRFCLLVWLAHALGYLLHEYAHSFTAWLLGWKENPLQLNYGHLDLPNLLLQSEIEENVDYAPIFIAGRGALAGVIAGAGILFGNGLFYLLSRRLYSFAAVRGRRLLALFAFLWCLTNLGNLWDYVPVRTFAAHGDMATLASGMKISPWWIVAILGIPFVAAIVHFFARLLPRARCIIFPVQVGAQIALTIICSFALFVFYGSAGIRGYGAVSHWISVCSCCVLFPVVLALSWPKRHAVPVQLSNHR